MNRTPDLLITNDQLCAHTFNLIESVTNISGDVKLKSSTAMFFAINRWLSDKNSQQYFAEKLTGFCGQCVNCCIHAGALRISADFADIWCGWRGSNPRPLASEANTLSTELQPQR